MFKNISEKQKFYLLIGTLVVVLFICFQVALKSTFAEIRKNKDLKTMALEAVNIPQQTALLKKQVVDLNNKYFNENIRADDNHEIILEKVSNLASGTNTSVTEYPARHIYQTMNLHVETHSIVLTGRFPDLLKVLYQLEVHERVGRLVSLEYFTETDRKTRRRNLYSRIYIQNYRNLKNNEDR
ncbi:hypothetical protein ES705_35914 [subsurface metagenome]